MIGGIMQHIEQAGVHSGDSACSLPPYNLPTAIQDQIREQVKALALELNVIGLMNVQMAVQGEDVFVLEVNPVQFDYLILSVFLQLVLHLFLLLIKNLV